MSRHGLLGGPLFWLVLSVANAATAQHTPAPTHLDCSVMHCDEVLPGATRFERAEGQPFDTGYDAQGAVRGWVGLSSELVDVPAYSGRPVVIAVGLDAEGVITGTRVIHHSEPILLAGIPESQLFDFVAFYPGHHATDRISVGSAQPEQGAQQPSETHAQAESMSVDSISGATVTALAANRTVLESARTMGVAVGVISAAEMRPGHFTTETAAWTWARLEQEHAFGRLTVTSEEMGVPASTIPFIDLWFTIADAPAIGRALIPAGDYDHLMQTLAPGEHLVVVLGRGTSSFKGSAFVRGGIFDRVRLEQGLAEIQFRDTDYTNLAHVPAVGAPHFHEGAIFIVRGGHLDPGQPFELVFLGSRHAGRGFTREYRSFESGFQLPSSIYQVDASTEELSIWRQAWHNHTLDAVVLGLWLLVITAIFAARRWTFAKKAPLLKLHTASMVVSLLLVGVHFAAQPSVTQMLTLIEVLFRGERPELFLSEPLLFLMWIFIAITSLIWGRGVFCGWVCPYGVMSELARKVGGALGIRNYELPDPIHQRARYLRYVVLAALIPLFLFSPELGERAAEIEPFKSTFLVPFWTRGGLFIAWWVVLFVASVFVWRPFCRYLCPMGAGLALFGSLRFAGPMRRAYCTSCKICTRGCEPKAIRPNGTIDPRECLNCMECEATYNDRDACPPLIGIDRLLSKVNRAPHEEEKLAALREQEKRVAWRPS